MRGDLSCGHTVLKDAQEEKWLAKMKRALYILYRERGGEMKKWIE